MRMEVEGLLVAILVEALRQLQRHLVWSFAAALLLMVLALVQPTGVTLPTEVLPLPIPLHGALAILISAYWVFGTLASFSLARANRIITLLNDQPDGVSANHVHGCGQFNLQKSRREPSSRRLRFGL